MEKISSAIENPLHGAFMMQTLPDYNHIVLKSLTVDAVVTFINAVYEYTTSHNVSFKLTSRISASVRDCVISRNPTTLDEYEFNRLSNVEIISCLRTTVQPRSKDEFVEIMTKYVKFKMSADAGPENFEAFYDALSRYKRRWTLFFDIMAADNESNVPHCNTKQNGSISLFIEPIPNGYGKNRANVLQNKKYKDVREFIAAFWKEVEADYARSKSYKTLELGFNKSYFAPDKVDSQEKKRSFFSPKKSDPRPSESRDRMHSMPGRHDDIDEEQVQQLLDSFDSSMIEEESDRTAVEEVNVEFARQHTTVGSTIETSDSLSAIDGAPRPQDKYQPKSTSASKTTSQSRLPTQRPRSPESAKQLRYGCWTMIREGKCDKGNLCKFSHDEKDLKDSWQRMYEQLNKSASKYGVPNQPERKSGSEPDYSSD